MMNNRNINRIVTVGAIIVGCLVVGLWFFLPFRFSPRNQAPITAKELFSIRMEAEVDRIELLLALKTKTGFIEAQFLAAEIRDLCLEADYEEGRKKWSAIADDMHSWYLRLAVEGTASLEEVLNELYTNYPFLKIEGTIEQKRSDNILIETLTKSSEWKTSSISWQNMPGLSISKNFSKENAIVLFEGEMVITSTKEGSGSGFVRLVVNGNASDIREIRSTMAAGGTSDPSSMVLTWAGELPSGKSTITVQAKVSNNSITLQLNDAGDIPKLILMR